VQVQASGFGRARPDGRARCMQAEKLEAKRKRREGSITARAGSGMR